MRNNVKYYLNQAANLAARRDEDKHFFLAAVGVRNDGTKVSATNIRTYARCREAHAETRLSRKLDVGSTVYVARVTLDGEWAMSRPCENCEKAMRTRGVKRVYYTIGANEFGCIILN